MRTSCSKEASDAAQLMSPQGGGEAKWNELQQKSNKIRRQSESVVSV